MTLHRARTVLWGSMAGAIDEKGAGLHCRADPLCDSVFHVAHDALPAAAALLRNAHELAVHGYVHVPIPDQVWNFTARESQGGRSKLGRAH